MWSPSALRRRKQETPPKRIYIIGNDGITLCREPPAALTEGEIVVASNEELHAARLSGKRLLALWNALPEVENRRKVGDRDALIDQLWSAIEALPDPAGAPAARSNAADYVGPEVGIPLCHRRPSGRRGLILAFLRRQTRLALGIAREA